MLFYTCCHVTVDVDGVVANTLAVGIDPVHAGSLRRKSRPNVAATSENGAARSDRLLMMPFHYSSIWKNSPLERFGRPDSMLFSLQFTEFTFLLFNFTFQSLQ